MRKTMMVLLASVTAIASSAAGAVTITRSYSTVSTFTSGPNPIITQNYTLTFDPAANAPGGTPVTLTNYSTNVSTSPFNNVASASYISNPSFGLNILSLFYSANGSSFSPGQNGFSLTVPIDGSGNPTNDGPNLDYSFAGASQTYSSVTNITTVVPQVVTAAVPEIGTWAMMIVGLGMVGGAIRRRRQDVTTRVRFA